MRAKVVSILACVVWTVVGCGGPERAPTQPIPGVDRAHPEDANPYDVEGGVTGPFLGTIVEEVKKAYEAEKGPVAIFPALTHDHDQGINIVNGLGEHMAAETAARLVDSGVSVVAASDLVNALRAAARPLAAYGSPADALALAAEIKAGYVVSGRADRKVFDLQRRDEALEIDWTCRRVSDGQIVARYRTALKEGPLANELYRYYRMPSEWEDSVRLEKPPAQPAPQPAPQ
jgi:hypothetical protein